MVHSYPSGSDPDDFTVVERRDPLIGSVLDQRFRLDIRLAAGGFGAIYRGVDLASGRDCAIKVLHAEHAFDAAVITRFRREGEILSQLRDPHTVSAFALGETATGTMYIAMELLHGESLYDRFRRTGSMPWKQVAVIARQICSSLAEAHAHGIVHRDLKPANIHLERRGELARSGIPGPRSNAEGRCGEQFDRVKVLDFGIAKALGPSDANLTQAGQMIGTFDYMAPEQMVGGRCTGASDIYTLGVLMYEMTCGMRPFGEASGPTHLLTDMLTKTPLRLASRAIVPLEFDDIVMRCVEREPLQRWTDIEALANALDRLLVEDDAATRMITAVTPMPTLRIAGVPARGSQPALKILPMPAPLPAPAHAQAWQSPPAIEAVSLPVTPMPATRASMYEIPKFELVAQQGADATMGRILRIALIAVLGIIAAVIAMQLY